MPDRRLTEPRRLMRALGATTAGVAAVALLAGCTGAELGASADDRVSIVATTTQVGDFTRELVGDGAQVTQLLNGGQSSHAFDPSAAQLAALATADALVINGAGLESWVHDAVAASGFDGELIDASTGIELFGTDDAHAHNDEVDAADGHDETSHDGHDHEGGNPHIWTDPALAVQMVENIATGLEAVDGVDASAVASNAQDYVARLDALDEWIMQNVDRVPVAERLLVTNHDAFTYFVDAYDLTFVGSVIPSFDDNAEPSAAEIDALVKKIRATGVQAVFSEGSISPKAAATIAKEAGVAVYSGEDALYGDALGVAGSDGETYLGSQIHNVRLILESWGVEPSALPSVLEG